jgi:hypothetical protein
MTLCLTATFSFNTKGTIHEEALDKPEFIKMKNKKQKNFWSVKDTIKIMK